MIAMKEESVVSVLRDQLATDETLCSLLAVPAESIAVPFQKSTTIEFLAVTVAMDGATLSRENINAVLSRITSLCERRLQDARWWGVEILIVSTAEQGSQKIIRVMIPKQCMATFSPSEFGKESRNFSDVEAGCIWYGGRSLLH